MDGETGGIDQNRHPRELKLAELAGQQLGVVSLAQLYGLTFTYEQVRWMVSQARLHRLYHNVYAVGHGAVIDRAHLLGALLSAGPGAFLSHRTAAAVWGLRAVNLHCIEVTVPGTGGRRRSDLQLHRTREQPHPDDIKSHGHLRVSSVPRLLVELSPREKPPELERLVTVAVQKRLLRLDARDGRADVEAALERYERRPGLATLKAVLAR